MPNRNFDLKEGKRRKEQGMHFAASSKREDLEYARELAKAIAYSSPTGECHADEVQEYLIEAGIDLGCSAGSLFKEPCWEFTGRFIPSERVSNHARLIRVWRLKE